MKILQVSSSLGPSSLGQYLGVAEGGVTLPALKISPDELPPGVDQDTVSIFGEMYKQHLNQLLDAVVNLNFASIQHIWVSSARHPFIFFNSVNRWISGICQRPILTRTRSQSYRCQRQNCEFF